MEKFDLIVIGSGPAGEKAAVKAAYFGHSVALIEKSNHYGGAGVNTGTLPSKTLKETSLYFSGKYERGLYGIDRDLKLEASISDFMYRKNYVVTSEGEEVRENLVRHGVRIYHGIATFDSPNQIHIVGSKEDVIQGDHIIIATGSYPFHPNDIPFDNKRVHDSDTILELTRFPSSICVLGAGVIGCEYATIFSTMGIKVFLINRNDQILNFVDRDIVESLLHQMENDGIDLLFNKAIKTIHVPPNDKELIHIMLESGEILHVDMLLFAAGRNGNTKNLKLENIGIQVDKRENIPVNELYQTSVPNVYAVGDVIGFPALANTSMDQGRVAVSHIFQTKDLEQIARIIPYGIYTVPEISTAGLNEDQAKKQNLNCEVGIAHHKNTARGKIIGAKEGFLKLVFTKDDQVIRGVHIIGYLATELVHLGAGLIEGKKTLYDVISRVYNFPTLHDLYKYAAYDGLSRLAGHRIKDS